MLSLVLALAPVQAQTPPPPTDPPPPIEAEPVDDSVTAGGLVLGSAWFDPSVDLEGGSGLGCIGLEGFRAEGWFRGGLAGHLCPGGPDLMAQVGGNGGLSVRPGPFLFSALAELGFGGLGIDHLVGPDTSVGFWQVGPTLKAGMGFDVFGFELSGYTSWAFPFDGTEPFQVSGVRLALLIGDFWPHETAEVAPRRRPPPLRPVRPPPRRPPPRPPR